jgi:hypothetical protein
MTVMGGEDDALARSARAGAFDTTGNLPPKRCFVE